MTIIHPYPISLLHAFYFFSIGAIYTFIVQFKSLLAKHAVKSIPIFTLALFVPSEPLRSSPPSSLLNPNLKKFGKLALVLSGIADQFLLHTDKPVLFAIGGLLFFSAHVCYLLAYRPKQRLSHTPLSIFCFIVTLMMMVGLIIFIFPRLRKTPFFVFGVSVYLFIEVVLISVLVQFPNTPDRCSRCHNRAIVGAFLFFVSDLILFNRVFAIERFYFPSWAVMLTYYLAQFLLACSLNQVDCSHKTGEIKR
ncbi:putative YhhN family protein [Blattamonas nauphoetae]|uniref:YhhN family protein n=1 Tax=Blattamonas nauphoetae TaxID=2049346 RepID=A0ABQ9XUB7_9EUKA|nr:putative YhhN family protein [Blattamonas nauphoetae]